MDGVTGNQRLPWVAVGSVAPLSVAKGLPDKFSYNTLHILLHHLSVAVESKAGVRISPASNCSS